MQGQTDFIGKIKQIINYVKLYFFHHLSADHVKDEDSHLLPSSAYFISTSYSTYLGFLDFDTSKASAAPGSAMVVAIVAVTKDAALDERNSFRDWVLLFILGTSASA